MSTQEKRESRKASMFRIIDQQMGSGLSQVDFCKNQNISIATFGYWRTQYLRAKQPLQEESQPKYFVPLKIETTVSHLHPIEIQLPNKIIMRCQGWQMEQLPHLIAELQKVEIQLQSTC